MNRFQKKIMLIDDNPFTLKSVALALEMNGFPTDKFQCPKTAVNAYQEAAYLLVVTDYRMPELSGIDVIKAIREKNNRAPIIVYTGFPDEKVTREIKAHNAVDLYKPLSLERLIDEIKKIQYNYEEAQ